MSLRLAQDLLEQAEQLAKTDRLKPKQVNLRRSVSAAYYALFHMLTSDLGERFARGSELRWLQPHFARTVEHNKLNAAAKHFQAIADHQARGQQPPYKPLTEGLAVGPDLALVSSTFVTLQQARHEADYDTRVTLSRTDVMTILMATRNAFEAWERVKRTREAGALLAMALLGGGRS